MRRQRVSPSCMTESACPLFPVRRLSSPPVCPLAVTDLELPAFQQNGRTIVDTNRMYKTFRRMEAEGRTSSLRPTIILSTNPTQPQTEVAVQVKEKNVQEDNNTLVEHGVEKLHEEGEEGCAADEGSAFVRPSAVSMSMDPLFSTLDFHPDKEQLKYDWLPAEIQQTAVELSEANNQDVEESEEKDENGFANNENDGYEIDARGIRVHPTHPIDIEQCIHPLSSPNPSPVVLAAAETSSFSLQHVSSMLLGLLLARSVQRSPECASTVADQSQRNVEQGNEVNGMQIILVNVALVM